MRIIASFLLLASLCLASDIKLGKPLMLKQPVSIAEVMQNPDAFVGQTIQVKGKITEVCQMMGCWMNLVDPATNKAIRIKVKDGEIVFPKDATGKTAVAEGNLTRLELTKEQAVAQAKHEAEENGKKFDPNSVKAPATIYQIQGTGAVLMNE